MFFVYNQNNSFGRFDFDKKAGITHIVIVEAKDRNEANSKAQSIGLYFDGSRDCSCCGARWHEIYDWEDGTEAPEIYGKPVTEFDGMGWMEPGFEIAIHYANDKIEWHGVQKKTTKKKTKKKTTKKTNAKR